ncbi:MAG: hypothetical protein J6C08_02590 [Campylobacter sp.]|uniref:hypothetical protein n=1 Tax=Campylobacter sp. TaxID=205 RepID=UPI001B0F7117|nr:hypothetical protein [Campylobacter sp.]MBO5063385.1 hypothetical protein [Campylobacter sp.]
MSVLKMSASTFAKALNEALAVLRIGGANQEQIRAFKNAFLKSVIKNPKRGFKIA